MEESSYRKQKHTITFTRKQLLITILVIIVLFGVLWIWKAIQVQSVKNELSKEEQNIRNHTRTLVVDNNKSFLRMIAKPYVWALRPEMMQGNTAQLNLYADDIVKEGNFVSIIVANNQGKIISSTDKRYEGKDMAALGVSSYLTSDSTVVKSVNDSTLVMISPVMSFNSRLGTLMITYLVKEPDYTGLH